METGMGKCARSIASFQGVPYNSVHIRPLAVSPLNHPESVPTPWGFSISMGRNCASRKLAKGMHV